MPSRSKCDKQNWRRSPRDHDQQRQNKKMCLLNSKPSHQHHHKQAITNNLPHHCVVSHHHGGLNQAQQIMSKTMTQNKWDIQYTTCSRFLALDLEPLKVKVEVMMKYWTLSLLYHPDRWNPNQNTNTTFWINQQLISSFSTMLTLTYGRFFRTWIVWT